MQASSVETAIFCSDSRQAASVAGRAARTAIQPPANHTMSESRRLFDSQQWRICFAVRPDIARRHMLDLLKWPAIVAISRHARASPASMYVFVQTMRSRTVQIKLRFIGAQPREHLVEGSSFNQIKSMIHPVMTRLILPMPFPKIAAPGKIVSGGQKDAEKPKSRI